MTDCEFIDDAPIPGARRRGVETVDALMKVMNFEWGGSVGVVGSGSCRLAQMINV
jgi:hypothetical protein